METMMKFTEALNNVIGVEGGYVDDKADNGGETYRGIARQYNPKWEGWSIIDRMKDKYPAVFKNELDESGALQELVSEFYYVNYWSKFKGDELPYIVAEELLEQSVNLGTWKTAGVNLQRALNLLNRNGKLFSDLVVDGLVGQKTLVAVKKVNERRLVKILNGLQFMRYYELDTKNSENERFAGWFDRV